jgi:hypothetical protein
MLGLGNALTQAAAVKELVLVSNAKSLDFDGTHDYMIDDQLAFLNLMEFQEIKQ